MHYNEIIRQTSPDRTHVDNTIDSLERGQLIAEIKMSKRERKQHGIHSQAKVMQLTDLGLTFMELKDTVDKYNESYNKLKKAVKQNFDHSKNTPKKTLVNILRSRGWQGEEVSKYKVFYEEARSMLSHLSPRQNIDALLTRYVSLLSQPEITENEFAMAVLNKIITDLLSRQISFIREDLVDKANLHLDNEEAKQHRHLFDYIPEEKIRVLDYIFVEGKSLDIRFTSEEAKQTLSAILNIFKPSKKAVDHFPYDSAIGEVVTAYLEGLKVAIPVSNHLEE